MSRPRPWSPPRKAGFRRIFDSGSTACWMRREPDGMVTCVVYIGYGDAFYDGIWTVECTPGAPILYEVYDKPHRVRWLDCEDEWLGGTLIDKRPIPVGPPRRRPKVRARRTGYRHVRHSRKDWLPRKFGRADA